MNKNKIEIYVIDKEQTEEESYKSILRLYKQYPNIFMCPKKWRELRRKYNNKGCKE